MKNKSLIISTGFAMFSMFFGSGNLVFPLLVGKDSGSQYMWAALGILTTGVLVPFMGVAAMMLYKGNTKAFFSSLGKIGTFWIPFIILGLMGPFGVLARCITVAHGSFKHLSDVPLSIFSLISCVLIYVAITNPNKIIPLLGKFLTPFLLFSLFAIGLFGYINSKPVATLNTHPFQAFEKGVFQGYQMMDLLASFFFSTFIISHLKQNGDININKSFIKSSILGASLLSAVYILLIFLGYAYAPHLEGVPPHEMLGKIAQEALGPLSAPFFCMSVILACFTTAVVLASLFADFLEKECFANKISNSLAICITLAIAFFVSTLDFMGIAKFLGPILETLYPALIVLTLVNIFKKLVLGKKNTLEIS